MNNLRIHGFIKTLSPLHIASTDSARIDLSTMNLVYSDKGVPCTLTQKLAVCSPEGAIHHVPVIASNNVAGRLRRHVAAHTLKVLQDKGEKVNIATYSALLCGAVTGRPDGADVKFAEMQEAAIHPYLGLYGGGPRMMQRRVLVHNALPYCEQTAFTFKGIEHPFLGQEHAAPKELFKLLSRSFFNRNDDLRELSDLEQARASIEDFENKLRERQALILSDSNAEQSSRHSTKTISAIEYVIPGVIFPMCFELCSVTDAQVGLFLESLASFVANERIGGWSRNGFGRFAFNDAVICDVDTGEVHDGVFANGQIDRDHAYVREKLQEWEQAKASINAADLNRLFSLPEPAKKKDKEKEAA